jgi:hypothetical protein
MKIAILQSANKLIMKSLENKKIALLVENGFEQIELISPKKSLRGTRRSYSYYFYAKRPGESLRFESLGRKI